MTAGAGQFSCGARKCGERRGLATFEVPFAYAEAGVDKQALVKARRLFEPDLPGRAARRRRGLSSGGAQVRLCPEHAQQLTFQKQQQLRRERDAAAERAQPRKRRRQGEEPAAEGRRGAAAQGPAEAAEDGRVDAALAGMFP